MSNAGAVIMHAIKNRVAKSLTTFDGRPVEVLVNPGDIGSDPEKMSVEEMWRTQPHLRSVVDFLSRNIAQLGMHTFTIDEDGERARDRTSPVAKVLGKRPNPYMTAYELYYDLVGNISLYNRAYWVIREDNDFGYRIDPFPAPWVTPVYNGYMEPNTYMIQAPWSDDSIELSEDQVVAFNGWNPSGSENSSPVETLRLILAEQYHSHRHRVQVWKKNGRVGSYLTRPAGAPEWNDTARKRFYQMFEAFVGDNGSRAGGTPMLEDGIELKRVGFNSADEQWSESVALSRKTVAQVYQVNPAMIGDTDANNYSNMREHNRSLYTNTLGPTLRMIEARLNAFVLPLMGADDTTFVEFNIEEKLRGSFEEQESILTTSVGAPWRTRNEARAIRNLHPIEGGDELITPLNVLEGGQASSQDGGTGDEDPFKAAMPVVAKHLERVARVYPSKGFNTERFDVELATDLESCDIIDSEMVSSVNRYAKDCLESGGKPDVDGFLALEGL